MNLDQYIANINQRYQLGNATEHTFRGDLQQLLESLVPTIRATNEPIRQSCGAPDYILTKKDIPVGFIEAKDIGDKDLDGLKKTGNKDQFDRYKASLNNLIFTDYLSFHLYRDGEFVTKITIAEIFPSSGGVSEGRGGKIVPLPENFSAFENFIKDFCTHLGQTIKSPKKLAEMMAGKARLLSDVIGKALTSDEEQRQNSSLKDQLQAFKEILINDITPQAFADVYAQTIAYGMFAARLHDTTLETFSRYEAAELIPKSNPFLRKLFQYIAGYDLDDRIKWVVDDLVQIFLACNVEEILKNFGKATKMEDPIIHFYETFLSEYDPKLRKARGVWYTPQPVVQFIVRAVDDILKTEFDLPQGLADTSKTKIKVDLQGKQVEQEVHKVQILDPATGTGTFLAETIKHIHKKFAGQQGIWSNYVETHLIPRLNGFELLMASYAMAHLKLDLLLTETGYKPTDTFPSTVGVPNGRGGQRLRVYLTNSLEEATNEKPNLFMSQWLTDEALQADHVKRETPVMCIIGNPPYSGESANKGEWIMKLMEDYKKEPGGKEKLKERNPKWINDDYVKFLRFGQHFIEKKGSGVLAFINPHGYLDNPTFRGMRWHLLKTYDKIFTIDLHGNSKKKETAPDGSIDQNVFDIMQGVSINIFVKTGKKKSNELGIVFHYDLYGKREMKYDFLVENTIKTIAHKELPNIAPDYFFVNKNFDAKKAYDEGFSVNELFTLNNVGVVTARDAFTIHNSKESLNNTIETFLNLDDETARTKFNLGKDVRDWQVNFAKKDLIENYPNKGSFSKITYRPFDDRWTFYTGNSKGFHCYPRNEVMQHFLKGDNVGLALCKQFKTGDNYLHAFITNKIIESSYVSNRTSEITSVFPLYLYPDEKNKDLFATSPNPSESETTPPFGHLSKGGELERVPNLNIEIVNKIANGLGIPTMLPNGAASFGGLGALDILDYIYAVLHSPTYREKYKEFLKIDFPRVPYPHHAGTGRGPSLQEIQARFWQLVKLGGEIRKIHLLESPVVENYITQYPEDGDNVVLKPHFVHSPPSEGCPTGGVVNKDHYLIKSIKIYHNKITKLPYNPALKARSKALRYAENLSEVLFWMQVHKGHFYKIDFDRQRIIGNYIVDFYVKKLGLVIEIDGSSHDGNEAYNQQRREYLESLGLKVYRIKVSDIMNQMNMVMLQLENYIIENYGFEPPRPLGTPPKEGDLGKVYINDTQYFDNVPQVAWEFYIGGYQPAQKWLKDRKNRKLEFDDILHYQKIIVALSETDRIMREIDKIEMEKY